MWTSPCRCRSSSSASRSPAWKWAACASWGCRSPRDCASRRRTPGRPLAEYMGDIVLQLAVLPNMARCLSLIGVAREVAALTGQPLRLPPHVVQAVGEPVAGQVNVAIEDPKLSARYAAALLRGVK